MGRQAPFRQKRLDEECKKGNTYIQFVCMYVCMDVWTIAVENARARLQSSATKLLSFLFAQGFCGVAEGSRVGEVKDPLLVESSIELYMCLSSCSSFVQKPFGKQGVRASELAPTQYVARPECQFEESTTSHKPRTLTKAACREKVLAVRRTPPSRHHLRKQRVLQNCLQSLTKAVKVSVPKRKLKPARQTTLTRSLARLRAEQVLPLPLELHTSQTSHWDESAREYMPTPTVRIVETSYEGPFFCERPRPERSRLIHCWGLRNVSYPQQREICANCLAGLRAQVSALTGRS